MVKPYSRLGSKPRRWNSTFPIKVKAAKTSQPKRARFTARSERVGRLRVTKRLKTTRETPAMARLKRTVRERDNFTCQYPGCGYYSKHIDVHHIAKRSQRPDLKFEPSNAICLCRKHHAWTDVNHDEAVSMGLLSTETYEAAQKQRREEVAA